MLKLGLIVMGNRLSVNLASLRIFIMFHGNRRVWPDAIDEATPQW